MLRSWMSLTLLAAAFATLSVVPAAADDHILPAYTFRDVSLIVTVTDPSDWQSVGDQNTSEEAGAFDFDADLPLALGLAEAHGIAAQHSTIGASGLQASGSLSSSASASLEGAAGVIATNDYQVTFSVAEAGFYSLQGDLTAAGEGSCTFSFTGGGIDHTFELTDESAALDFSGALPAGSYILFVNLGANVNVNLDVDESQTASGSFDFELLVSTSVPNEQLSWGSVKALFR